MQASDRHLRVLKPLTVDKEVEEGELEVLVVESDELLDVVVYNGGLSQFNGSACAREGETFKSSSYVPLTR